MVRESQLPLDGDANKTLDDVVEGFELLVVLEVDLALAFQVELDQTVVVEGGLDADVGLVGGGLAAQLVRYCLFLVFECFHLLQI